MSPNASVGTTLRLGQTQVHIYRTFRDKDDSCDGSPTVREIAEACLERGYEYAAVTDHSHGLKIAGGMSMAEAADQRQAIDDVNALLEGRFRLLQRPTARQRMARPCGKKPELIKVQSASRD